MTASGLDPLADHPFALPELVEVEMGVSSSGVRAIVWFITVLPARRAALGSG